MRKLLMAVLFSLVLLVAACGNVKDVKFTADNTEEVIDKVLKSKDLTEQERLQATLAIGRAQAKGESLEGKTVGELLSED